MSEAIFVEGLTKSYAEKTVGSKTKNSDRCGHCFFVTS